MQSAMLVLHVLMKALRVCTGGVYSRRRVEDYAVTNRNSSLATGTIGDHPRPTAEWATTHTVTAAVWLAAKILHA